MKELICIVCPKGCHLHVDEQNDYIVTGNSCPRGAEYGKTELKNPTRVLTTTVRVSGGSCPRCSVKTDAPIPKPLIFKAMQTINTVCVPAPVKIGDIIIKNILNTGADVVATKNIV